jgi:hypothetical protein
MTKKRVTKQKHVTKQKRKWGDIGFAAVILTVIALFAYSTSTVRAENSISINVQREVIGQQILKIHVSVYLTISYAGTISSSSINGKIQVYFDTSLKQEIALTSPQITGSGQKYSLASFNLTAAQIQSWATAFGSHTLKFLVPAGATLSVTFQDGKTEMKLYGEAMAILYLNVESDSGIIVADITFETGFEIKPFDVFRDATCTIPVTQVDWGTLTPGGHSVIVVYIRNGLDTPLTITFTTANWIPSNAAKYLTLTWNLTNNVFSAKETKPVKFTLSVAPDIAGITNFSFGIVLTGTG